VFGHHMKESLLFDDGNLLDPTSIKIRPRVVLWGDTTKLYHPYINVAEPTRESVEQNYKPVLYP